MAKHKIIYAPRAQRDLAKLEKRDALKVLNDLELLEAQPWPPAKLKKLRGHDYWEVKSGDFRTIFFTLKKNVVILRIVNRRDLEKSIGRIDIRTLQKWLSEQNLK